MTRIPALFPVPSADLPPDLAGRPVDDSGVPVPFACGDDGLGEPVRKRCIQCALSRICAMCGRSLSWDVTFVGAPEEAARNEFRMPPMHGECAEVAVTTARPALDAALLADAGPRPAAEQWAVVVTGGFELLRPGAGEAEMRVLFAPNSVRGSRLVDA
jgi:hypothetical protein